MTETISLIAVGVIGIIAGAGLGFIAWHLVPPRRLPDYSALHLWTVETTTTETPLPPRDEKGRFVKRERGEAA